MTSEQFLMGLGNLLQMNQNVAADMTGIMEFQLDSKMYTVDFNERRSSKGSTGKADCTFIISESDFMKMIKKEADAMELFMSQKLKLDGI